MPYLVVLDSNFERLLPHLRLVISNLSYLQIKIIGRKLSATHSKEKCYKWVKVFKNGPSKICGRQPLKNLMSSTSFT